MGASTTTLQMTKQEPQPCKRFKHMIVTAAFLSCASMFRPSSLVLVRPRSKAQIIF
jgi:hypothetical protein